MLKNEMDVLVIAHNICVAFDFIPARDQEKYLRQLRSVEREVIRVCRIEKRKQEVIT